MLLISTQKCQFQQRFENSLLPQLIELYQTNPEQLELALGDQAIHLERVLQGWQQGQECYKLNDYQPDLQLDGPAVAYREDALYANLRRSMRKTRPQSILVRSAQHTFRWKTMCKKKDRPGSTIALCPGWLGKTAFLMAS